MSFHHGAGGLPAAMSTRAPPGVLAASLPNSRRSLSPPTLLHHRHTSPSSFGAASLAGHAATVSTSVRSPQTAAKAATVPSSSLSPPLLQASQAPPQVRSESRRFPGGTLSVPPGHATAAPLPDSAKTAPPAVRQRSFSPTGIPGVVSMVPAAPSTRATLGAAVSASSSASAPPGPPPAVVVTSSANVTVRRTSMPATIKASGSLAGSLASSLVAPPAGSAPKAAIVLPIPSAAPVTQPITPAGGHPATCLPEARQSDPASCSCRTGSLSPTRSLGTISCRLLKSQAPFAGGRSGSSSPGSPEVVSSSPHQQQLPYNRAPLGAREGQHHLSASDLQRHHQKLLASAAVQQAAPPVQLFMPSRPQPVVIEQSRLAGTPHTPSGARSPLAVTVPRLKLPLAGTSPCKEDEQEMADPTSTSNHSRRSSTSAASSTSAVVVSTARATTASETLNKVYTPSSDGRRAQAMHVSTSAAICNDEHPCPADAAAGGSALKALLLDQKPHKMSWLSGQTAAVPDTPPRLSLCAKDDSPPTFNAGRSDYFNSEPPASAAAAAWAAREAERVFSTLHTLLSETVVAKLERRSEIDVRLQALQRLEAAVACTAADSRPPSPPLPAPRARLPGGEERLPYVPLHP
eukprot:TRINITY_DN9629_c0_g1_i1.p1 TRINITY_DN9629_c0_g1~~TRINITY_DN9629_c0_g1_i1.p1  ORF type:complete len:632 (+),score=102.32 TRINITY_DN9629_c0_g1_i1:93-1988(+)